MGIGEKKKEIEETRSKLNKLLEANAPDITEEILDVSRELDILIKDYYKMLEKNVKRNFITNLACKQNKSKNPKICILYSA